MTPLLIHAGYPKTASSWLDRFLFRDPRLGFLNPFEHGEMRALLIYPDPLGFDVEFCRSRLRPLVDRVRIEGLVPVLTAERLSGSPHSGGYDSKELADRLAAVFPGAHVLMVIREQRSMILSTYKQYVRHGGTCSPQSYVMPPERERARVPLFDLCHFEYHRLIGYYFGLFGRSNVLVLPYELFRGSPSDYVSRIMLFCDLEPNDGVIQTLPVATEHHPSLSAFMTAFLRRLNLVVAARGRLNPHILVPVSLRRHRRIRSSLLSMDSFVPPSVKERCERVLNAQIEEMVGDRYKQSNQCTAKMLEVDLAQYGYDV